MPSPNSRDEEYVAVIDQDEVTDEVRDIAVKYDPLNRSGREGFHVTEDGELHIDDSKVMAEHRLIEKKIPNDAVRIVPLPSASGQLVHQYGENGFRLHELPIPEEGSVVGLLGRNGVGKTTALRILAGDLVPNFGDPGETDWEHAAESFRGTTLQTHLQRLADSDVETVYKDQRVDELSDAGGGTARDLLPDGSGVRDRLLDDLNVRSLLDRPITDLSGGERQRVAVAATLAADADLYLFDEPSSFLDAGQRLTVARVIRERVREADAAGLVVEHDLASLDVLADAIHVIYGEPGGFGVVSGRLSTRSGINQFLDGYLSEENVRIREEAIEFPSPSERGGRSGDPVVEYPTLEAEFPAFSLTVDPGRVHAGETVGIVGENALGKTTFVKLLAGSIEPSAGIVPDDVTVSYKPQYISPDGQGTVRDRLSAVTDLHSQRFQTRIRDPFDLEELYDRSLDALSGGELQRVGIALCFARDADLYLLDEPSAFLDVGRRVTLADRIRRFAGRSERPVLVVDHDLFVVDRIADRLVVFEGTPGERGHATPPQSMREGMNAFLSSLDITFRRDEGTGRPRVNDPGSRLDREQKADGEYYYPG
ncbi:ribosome biogenesis/translation initiation ATPase RLI [Halosimplex aquaticum]|uniref:Ribosome biogenesis/translation initiation ATPase RLI n=1 Tax=Halosimplex aquaticum TaxID=3026162 RepID=A0ABD5Y3A2_9EURY|nr:ribosome biogenesis/translation initiation ATPase RLI [Halosimplex aquaticum]